MIKIRLDKEKLEKLLNLHKEILLTPYEIKEKIKLVIDQSGVGTTKLEFYSFIHDNIDEILFGVPGQLQILVGKIKPLYERAIENYSNDIDYELKNIFNYVKFRDNRTGYGAYKLTEFLQVNVCPYCNRIPIITYEGSSSTRPQLDHWLSQELYPYFALSIFNLIPACPICNTNFKKRTNFNFDEYIHPYVEGYEKEYKFSYKPKKISDLMTTVDDFIIEIKASKNICKEIEYKGKNTIGLMEIEGTYNEHRDKALNIIRQAPLYSSEAISEQLKIKDKHTGNPVFKSLKEYIEISFDIKVDIEDFGIQEFSKFKKDLAEDIGLIFDEEELRRS